MIKYFWNLNVEEIQNKEHPCIIKEHGFLHSLDIKGGIYTWNSGSKRWDAFETKNHAFLDTRLFDKE